MQITISGKAGSGKSTVAKLLSEKLGFRHYSIGDLMRFIAAERKLSLLELNRQAEKDKSIDIELDSELKELGATKDNFVVDGRLTAYFIPSAKVRIFLDAEDEIRANRILKDKRQNEKNDTLKESIENIRKREESEKIRYKKYYGVDYLDKNLYNFVIDTTKLSPNQVVEKIIEFVKAKQIANKNSDKFLNKV